MAKFQSQAGASIADTYDVVASTLDLDEFNASQGVNPVEEMGGRVFAERVNSVMIKVEPAAPILQTITFDLTLLGSVATPTPDSPTRLMSLSVMIAAAEATRIKSAAVYMRDLNLSREVCVWSWDIATDDEVECRWNDDGAGAAAFFLLRSTANFLPELMTRAGNERVMPQLLFRGLSATFGAGTVNPICVAHLLRATTANPAPGEPSSHGLPIPSW